MLICFRQVSTSSGIILRADRWFDTFCERPVGRSNENCLDGAICNHSSDKLLESRVEEVVIGPKSEINGHERPSRFTIGRSPTLGKRVIAIEKAHDHIASIHAWVAHPSLHDVFLTRGSERSVVVECS